MQGLDMLSQHILVTQHFSAVRARIRAHDAIVRQQVLLPRVAMRKGLRAKLAHMVLGRAEVEALFVTLERLQGGQDVLAVGTGVAQSLVGDAYVVA